jgi:hypothetical protein
MGRTVSSLEVGPDGVVEILDKEMVGKLGDGYSDTLHDIIMNWMSEQGYLAKGGSQKTISQKKNIRHQIRHLIRGDIMANVKKGKVEREPTEEIDLLDYMF